ncbi:MAG TPA: hypothetical protein VJ385_11320, partial [Fibrobacteria bacterium]|nr:hypothetical protein [Fibrobacteria bacterium]
LSGQANGLKQTLSKFKLKQSAPRLEGLPAGVSPEMLMAIQQFLSNQGMTGGASLPAQAGGITVRSDWSAGSVKKGGSRDSNGSSQPGKPVIALDDRDFGKF